MAWPNTNFSQPSNTQNNQNHQRPKKMKMRLNQTPAKIAVEIDPINSPNSPVFVPLIEVIKYKALPNAKPVVTSLWRGRLDPKTATQYGNALKVAAKICATAQNGCLCETFNAIKNQPEYRRTTTVAPSAQQHTLENVRR